MTLESAPAPSQRPPERCPRCGTEFLDRAVFCQHCGATKPSMMGAVPVYMSAHRPTPDTYRQYYAKRTSWRQIIKAIVAIGALSLSAFLVLAAITLVWGATIVLPEIGSIRLSLFIIAPTLVSLLEISGVTLEAYYILVVAAIIASLTWLALQSARSFRLELSMKAESRKHSALFDLCALMFAVTFMDYVIVFVLILLGYNPSDAIGGADLWEMLLLLANASVWEELASRVLLIGIPLILIDLARNRVRPKRLSYIFGGGFELGIPETTLLVVSSIFFGFAHYEGWGAWKIFPTAVAGLAFGYMFLKHGLASAIVLHFAFDYLSLPGEAFGDGVTIVTVVLILMWIALGLVCIIYFITRIAEFVTGSKYLEPRVPPPAPAWFMQTMPQPTGAYGAQTDRRHSEVYGPAPAGTYENRQPIHGGFAGGYVCPVCGNTEARWIDGRFQCLKCGHLL